MGNVTGRWMGAFLFFPVLVCVCVHVGVYVGVLVCRFFEYIIQWYNSLAYVNKISQSICVCV